jgi:hypothetical protein
MRSFRIVFTLYVLLMLVVLPVAPMYAEGNTAVDHGNRSAIATSSNLEKVAVNHREKSEPGGHDEETQTIEADAIPIIGHLPDFIFGNN